MEGNKGLSDEAPKEERMFANDTFCHRRVVTSWPVLLTQTEV